MAAAEAREAVEAAVPATAAEAEAAAIIDRLIPLSIQKWQDFGPAIFVSGIRANSGNSPLPGAVSHGAEAGPLPALPTQSIQYKISLDNPILPEL